MSRLDTERRFGRILVVDDTSANLQLLTNFLTEQGYEVFPASDGELALEFVQATLPDLILLDVRMPEMDGYEVCRRLKADERTNAVPVIFISALEEERNKVQGFSVGAVDYITKPFQPEEVLARVEIHLRLRELAEQLEQKVEDRTEALTLANQRLEQEVHERRQAEERLHESEEWLRTSLEATRIGIFDWDVAQDVWHASPTYYTMLGYPPKTGPGDRKEWVARLHPDDRLLFIEKNHSVLSGDSDDYQYEARVRHADGSYRWQYVKGFGVERDATGKVTRMLGIRMDIHERKSAEEEVRALNASLAATLRAIPDLLFELDEAGTYRSIWATRNELLAAGESILLGRRVGEMHPPETATEIMAAIDEAAQNGSSYGRVIKLDLQGDEHWFELSTALKEDPQAPDKRFIVLSRDISERKRANEELRRLTQDLEKRVEERTAELAKNNAELERMNKLFVGREMKMIELKKKIRELEEQGNPEKTR